MRKTAWAFVPPFTILGILAPVIAASQSTQDNDLSFPTCIVSLRRNKHYLSIWLSYSMWLPSDIDPIHCVFLLVSNFPATMWPISYTKSRVSSKFPLMHSHPVHYFLWSQLFNIQKVRLHLYNIIVLAIDDRIGS